MSAWTLHIDGESIARLSLDVPGEKVNVLSAAVLRELRERLEEIQARSDVRMLRFESGKPGMFIAGADIKEIEAIRSGRDADPLVAEGQGVMDLVARNAYADRGSDQRSLPRGRAGTGSGLWTTGWSRIHPRQNSGFPK